eukprot:TRINITY_DN1171_c0_g1_i5.p1 TRINITY_DN1171_c0_g1~~TRINITY_DN1171_c0_g1_i5.p1  ORF type:complete len:407 (+),score=84.25 TRINITY_DN1171_c0_g1_i5:49-1269(+)
MSLYSTHNHRKRRWFSMFELRSIQQWIPSWLFSFPVIYTVLAMYSYMLLVFLPDENAAADVDLVLAVVPVFRAFLLPILLFWMWAIIIAIFHTYQVHYEDLLGIAIHSNKDIFLAEIIQLSNILSVAWIFCVVTYSGAMISNNQLFLAHSYDFLFFITMTLLVALLWPSDLRSYLTKVLLQIVIAPFGRTTFAENFVADFITSMPRLLFDCNHLIVMCIWYTTEYDRDGMILTLLAALPLYFRFMQCIRCYYYSGLVFPHVANAGKYFCSILAVIYGRLYGDFVSVNHETSISYIIWILLFFGSTLYAYIWDIFVDWRMIDTSGKGPYLRENRIFKQDWVYWYAIISNFLLRFAKTLTITPAAFSMVGFRHEMFVFVLAALELFRRCQWSIFRIENELVQHSMLVK